MLFRSVSLSEEIGSELEGILKEKGLIETSGRYMELHVDEVLNGAGLPKKETIPL